MTGSPDNNSLWRRTTILVRADILEKAREQKIDLSHICNRALADLLEIDLSQQPLGSAEDPLPVMVAPDTVPVAPISPAGMAAASLHPVVNANDPTAVRTLLKAKKPRPTPPAAIPEPGHAQEKTPSVQEEPEGIRRAEREFTQAKPKKKVSGTGKRGKEDIIKTFITETIFRGEPDEAILSRDEMFDHFSRWCRDHRITPVPEKKQFSLALKNQFAFAEKTVNGIRCWTNVRVR
jgi:hypothetical protein